jgi:hypothetical protein
VCGNPECCCQNLPIAEQEAANAASDKNTHAGECGPDSLQPGHDCARRYGLTAVASQARQETFAAFGCHR